MSIYIAIFSNIKPHLKPANWWFGNTYSPKSSMIRHPSRLRTVPRGVAFKWGRKYTRRSVYPLERRFLGWHIPICWSRRFCRSPWKIRVNRKNVGFSRPQVSCSQSLGPWRQDYKIIINNTNTNNIRRHHPHHLAAILPWSLPRKIHGNLTYSGDPKSFPSHVLNTFLWYTNPQIDARSCWNLDTSNILKQKRNF